MLCKIQISTGTYAPRLGWHSNRFVVMLHGSDALALLLDGDELEYPVSNFRGQAEQGGSCIMLHASRIIIH